MKDIRYDGKEKEKKKNPIKKLVKTSAAVGGGVVAYKKRASLQKSFNTARANVAEYTSRVLDKNGVVSRRMSESKVVLRGISAALGDNPSITRLVRAAVDPKVAKAMKRSAQSSVNLDINRKFNPRSSIENGKKTQVGDAYMKTFVNGGSKHFKNPLEHKAVVAKQGNLILDELKKNPFVKDMGEDNFIDALTNFDHQEGRILSEPEEHIDNFLEKLEEGYYSKKYSFKNKEERGTFKSDIIEAIDKHKNLQAIKENHADEIRERVNAYTAAAAFGLINDAHKAPNVMSRSLRKQNYRNIMLSDVENLSIEQKRELGLTYVKHENNKKIEVDVTKELRNTLDDLKNNKFFDKLMEEHGVSFLEMDPKNIQEQRIHVPKEHKDASGRVIVDKQTRSYYDRLSDIRLDENLMINELTGEIIDNRHVKNAAVDLIDGFHKSVKMPFLNFNPVDLTPWQAMRSGKTKEGFHLLPAGSVQGFVRTLEGDTFDKAAQKRHESGIRGGFKNNNNFYTGGNVFNYTKEGGLQLIDQNLYLAPSQFGPMSRMMENMVNYTGHELVKERNFWQRLFDIGNQENDSRWTTYKKAIQKLKDPNYGPNAIAGIMFNIADAAEKGEVTQEAVSEIIYGAYNSLRAGTQKNARSLSQEVLDFYAPEVNKAFKHIKVEGEAFNLSNITDDTYMRETMMAFAEAFEKDNVGKMKTTHNRRMFKAGESKATVESVEDPTVRALKNYADSFARNEEEFINAMEVAAPTKLPHGFETMVPIAVEDQALISKTDNARRTFQQYILRFLDKKAFDLEEEAVRKGVRKRSSIDKAIAGKSSGFRISDKDIETIKDLETLTDLMLYDAMGKKGGRESEARTFFKDILNVEHDGIEKLNESAVRLINGNYEFTDLGLEFQEAITRAQPLWGRAPETSTPSLTGMDFMIMRKSQWGDHFRNAFNKVKEQLSVANQIIRSEGGLTTYSALQTLENLEVSVREGVLPNAKNFAREMFAGRHRNGDNLENVTTSTAIMYGLAERLDNQIQNFGLGLSRQNMGSFQSIMANQYGRRIVLPYIAYQQAMYFDGLTGDQFSDTAADAYVTAHTTLQSIKEATQINKALRPWKSMLDQVGFDQAEDWVGIKQFNFLTMGLLNDFRSGEETQYYYEHGEDAIRKNRYWSIGSPSPWSGGGVDHYEANWYRKLKSDYKFTDTMYGSEKEYWANHWMPTLTNPLAPIRHFITDPNHYEKKHEADRPYAVVGGFSEIQNIPLIGPALDGTVGRILKPRTEHKGLEKAHEEYLSAINDYIASQYTAVNDGAHVVVSPSGQVTVNNLYYQGGQKAGVGLGAGQLGGSGGYGGAGGIGSGEPTETNGITYGANAGIVDEGKNEIMQSRIVRLGNALGVGSGEGGPVAGVGYGGVGYPSYRAMISASEDTKQNLAAINYRMVVNKKGIESRAIDSLQNLHDPNLLHDLDDAERIGDLKGMGMDAFYSAGELAGIYGFATKTLIGFDESWRGTTLAPSNLMTSYSRAFWDMNLGGMGGSLSEIGRRYVPRDMNKLYYSPIRNEMPDWLPGLENGIQGDFLHGDPYCVSPDTLIETHGGLLVRADEICENSIIKTHKGVWRKVDAIQRRDLAPEEKAYSITISTISAFPMTVSEEHPILTVLNDSHRNGKKAKPKLFSPDLLTWTQAKDLEIGDYVAYPRPKNMENNVIIDMADIVSEDMLVLEDKVYYGRGKQAYVEALLWLKNNGIPSFKRGERKALLEQMGWDCISYENAQATIRGYKKDSYFFPRFIEINESIAYFMGNWVAEGSANLKDGLVSFAANKNEGWIYEQLEKSMNNLLGRSMGSYGRKGTNGISSSVCAKPLAQLLVSLFGSGARNKRLPDWFINLPNNILMKFLKGYFDGDGCYFNTNNRKRVSLKTTSVDLAYQVRQVLLKLGVVASVSKDEKIRKATYNEKEIVSGISYQVNANGKAAYELANLLGYELGEHKSSNKEKYYIDEEYVYMRVEKIEELSKEEVPVVIGFEVGIDDSFCVAGVATHNTKIQHGEMRLPGKAYEALHDLHPDGTGTGEWANYGAFDRFRILADVAPNSEQFAAAKHEVTLLRQNGGMTAEMEYEYDQVMKQRKERQSEHRWYNKRFTNADIQTKTVTVTQVLDANTFMTKEFANPIKLAGVDITDNEGDAAEWLSQFIKYGEKIKIGIADDPATRYNNDTYQTISAVVYANKNDKMNGRLFTESIKGQSLNEILANKSWNSQVKLDDDGSAVSTRALYGNDVIAVGKALETITHDILPNIPLFGVVADKILQVRSPIESYIREEVYNKSWKPWQQPIEAWVKPMLNTVAANNPIIAAGQGAAIGWLSGKVGPSNKVSKYRGTGKVIGAAVGAAVSTARVFYEEGAKLVPGGDNVWIPENVRKEREIDEYFDRLRYVKYKGLYEKTKEIAKKTEGVDVDRFFEAADESGRSNSILRRFVAERSRWLKLARKTGYGDISAIEETLDSLSSKLGEVEEDRQVYQAGKYTALAIQYRKEYESTFYGMDAKSVDHNSLLKSLSPVDREYIPAFLEADNAKDRQKILKYVPNDIKRLLQAKWGMKEDSKESIQSFFSNHYLPDQNWEGWSAAVSLDDIKIKVMQKHGVNPTEAGYWGKDQGRAEDHAAKAIPMHSLASKIDTGRLKKILSGAGLSDVNVTMTKSYGEGPGGINISTNMVKDIKGEVLAMLNNGFTI